MIRSFVVIITLWSTLPLVSISAQSVSSPDKKNSITFVVNENGLHYSIRRKSSEIVKSSRISFREGDVEFISRIKVSKFDYGDVDVSYTLPFGKRSNYHNKGKSLTIDFVNERGEQGRIESRAFNDGVAFRLWGYRDGKFVITEENTEFNFPQNEFYAQLWHEANEGMYDKRSLNTLNDEVLLFPALVRSDERNWCLLTEASVECNYCATQLKKSQVSGLKTSLAGSVTATDTLKTPWRLFIIGDLPTIVESSLVMDLSTPTTLKDLSWIKPGVAVFPWWYDHLASSNEEVLRTYVDLAAAMGWEWIEFDVALVGTDYHTSTLWKSTDWIKGFVDYAHEKGILVYGWDEYKVLDTPEKRDKLYTAYKQLGIDGIKIDFLNSDEQHMMCFREAAVRHAAKYNLMVSFHGETIPRGLQRTLPNLLSHEAVRGAEYYTFASPPEPNPVHNTMLPFTRNVIGSMDYTPATFSAPGRKTTYAHELALPFVFESGWMVMADSPESYLNSRATSLLRDVEASWDETKLLDGFPGEYVVVARRKGDKWFVAAINATSPREVHLDLRKLGISNAVGDLFADLGGGDDVTVQKCTISKGKITVPLRQNGGFVIRIESPTKKK